jgi:hypothetical protein
MQIQFSSDFRPRPVDGEFQADSSPAGTGAKVKGSAYPKTDAGEFLGKALAAQPVGEQALQAAIEQEPFLAYLSQTECDYSVALPGSTPMVIAKSFAIPEIFPPRELSPGQRALRLTNWMGVGLITAGVITLSLLPLVLWRSIRLLRRPGPDLIERRRARLAVILAFGFASVGGALMALLLLRLVP